MKTADAAPLQWGMLMEKRVEYQSSLLGFLLNSALETGVVARQAAALQGWVWGLPVGGLQVLRSPCRSLSLAAKVFLDSTEGEVIPPLAKPGWKAVVLS